MAVSFRRDLEWRHKSPATVRTYMDAIRCLDEFLTEKGMPKGVSRLSREHLEAFVADQLERHSANTAKLRFAACKAMFTWLVEEGELERSPMERMTPPTVMVIPVRVVDTPDLKKLLAACGEGPDEFSNRRDTAITRLLIARGPRVGELVSMTTEDVDLDHRMFSVVGKGAGR
jgi:site-specific recombinase XerC